MLRTPLALLLAGTAGTILLADALRAQAIGDATLSATISQRLEVDSNLDLDVDSPGTSTFTDTAVNLALVQETQTQQLTFGLDTGLRALWRADEDFEFTFASPTGARAGFRQDWASGSFSTDLRFRQRRVDFLEDVTFQEVIVEDVVVLIPDTLERRTLDATERRYDAGFTLALATDAPSSYRIAFQGTRIDFSEDVSGLAERQDVRGEAGWTLRLNPVLSSVINTSLRQSDIDDATDRRIRVADVDAGFAYDVSEDLNLRLGLGYADRRERVTVGGVRQTIDTSGPLVRAGLRYQVDDGLTLIADARVSDEADDTRLSGDLRATYALPGAVLSANLSQTFTGAGTGDEVRVTRAGLGFATELDALTSVSFNANYALQVDQDVAAAEDITRADFTASINRAISPELFATAGYRFRYRDEVNSATSNAVFFSIGRTFETRF